eukprot:1721460-Pyramimonas_sp.AAC.1
MSIQRTSSGRRSSCISRRQHSCSEGVPRRGPTPGRTHRTGWTPTLGDHQRVLLYAAWCRLQAVSYTHLRAHETGAYL